MNITDITAGTTGSPVVPGASEVVVVGVPPPSRELLRRAARGDAPGITVPAAVGELR